MYVLDDCHLQAKANATQAIDCTENMINNKIIVRTEVEKKN